MTIYGKQARLLKYAMEYTFGKQSLPLPEDNLAQSEYDITVLEDSRDNFAVR